MEHYFRHILLDKLSAATFFARLGHILLSASHSSNMKIKSGEGRRDAPLAILRRLWAAASTLLVFIPKTITYMNSYSAEVLGLLS